MGAGGGPPNGPQVLFQRRAGSHVLWLWGASPPLQLVDYWFNPFPASPTALCDAVICPQFREEKPEAQRGTVVSRATQRDALEGPHRTASRGELPSLRPGLGVRTLCLVFGEAMGEPLNRRSGWLGG